MKDFDRQVENNVTELVNNKDMHDMSRLWLRDAVKLNYAYNFNWLGVPIIQKPTDIYAMQELIWKVKPDLIIEAGIARGGSIVFSASMLALLNMADGGYRKVIGIDVDIREHTREAIDKHPLKSMIEMVEGSSVDGDVIETVKQMAEGYDTVMVFLDSNHTHDHVLGELEAYAPLVSEGSYCVVFDTGIEDLPEGSCDDREWGKGNNPKTAVWKYLETHNEFEIDKRIESKILVTAASDGFLKRIKQ